MRNRVAHLHFPGSLDTRNDIPHVARTQLLTGNHVHLQHADFVRIVFLARIEELVSEYHVEKIVLGYPKNMNNTIGERAQKSLEFKEMLERRTGLEVIMWDERLTTVEANRTLMEASVRRENRKQYLDQLAAVFILQGYLDSLSC